MLFWTHSLICCFLSFVLAFYETEAKEKTVVAKVQVIL